MHEDKFTPNALAAAKKRLIAQAAKWTSGVCDGFAADAQTGDNVYRSVDYCHAWVTRAFQSLVYFGGYKHDWSSLTYTQEAKPFFICDSHSQKTHLPCSREAADFLIKWLANESPFAEYVLNRDDEESLLKGGIILLCGPGGLNLAQAMWMCKVHRFVTEGQKAADTFITLVKGGVDGMVAVYVASLIRTISGATFGYTGPEGHSTVISENTNVKKFVQKDVQPKAVGTADLFGTGKGAFTAVQGFCAPIKKDDGWGGKIEGSGITGKDLVKRVLAWQKKEFGDLVVNPPQMTIEEPSLPDGSKSPDGSTVFLEVDM